jgi:hypothetical protein
MLFRKEAFLKAVYSVQVIVFSVQVRRGIW